ncbi:hypothetical protein [Bosea minatitlanensis]|jgi:hypothetical protein|uniref:Transposase n=1 Tax=Bosea minatitlanensis TaxID=128782 RepID=A0ABW0F3Y8_9HYPH|nr:hypothetical protein [Bosea minatitlanensis]
MPLKDESAKIAAIERFRGARGAFSAANILNLNYPGVYRIARGLV